MLEFKIDARLTNSNLTVRNSTPEEDTIKRLGATLWLDFSDLYVQRTPTGVFLAAVDRVSARRYVPGVAGAPPQRITHGLRKAARFAYQANNAAPTIGNLNSGWLKPEDDWEAGTLSGVWLKAILFRVPKNKGVAGSELIADVYNYGGSAMIATGDGHAMTFIGSPEGFLLENEPGGPVVNYEGPYNDQVWHYVVIYRNADTNESYLRVDGVTLQQNLKPELAPYAAAPGRKRINIGYVPAEFAPFLGDLGAVIYIPDREIALGSDALAAIESHLAAIKAELTA